MAFAWPSLCPVLTLTGGTQMVLALGALMVMVGLAFKLSAVPFHFWCPDVFEGATAEVNAFLSVASKAAALGLLVRVALAFSYIPVAFRGYVGGRRCGRRSMQAGSVSHAASAAHAVQSAGPAVVFQARRGCRNAHASLIATDPVLSNNSPLSSNAVTIRPCVLCATFWQSCWPSSP